MTPEASARGPTRRRLAGFYAGLLALTLGAVVVLFALGSDREAAPAIAGGYDVADSACLGDRVDILQSGRFVNVTNADSTIEGQLKIDDQRLSGTVDCIGGGHAQLSARIGDEVLIGRVGAQPLRAVLRREPPEPGAPNPRAPHSIAGDYAVSPPSDCLGGRLSLDQSGSRVTVAAKDRELGALRYREGRFAGRLTCRTGDDRPVAGAAADRKLDVLVGDEHVVATKQRDFTSAVEAFFLAVVIVMLSARLVGSLMPRIGQPRVMGEVLAGLALGPTVLGALLPGVQNALFPSDIVPYIGVAANLGLIFYMFLIGLEVDPELLRGRLGATVTISNTGVVVPMIGGTLIALPIFGLLAPDVDFAPFALFMGVAMSITAFPVLARIIVERRMLKRPLGALALASAAIDDVTAWLLIAVATAVAAAGGTSGIVRTLALAVAFGVVIARVARPLLARASVAYDEAGRVPAAWITAIFAAILLAAYTSEWIGISLLFGAFVLGLAMPRHAGLTEDVTHRIEDFVVTLLLPLFFAFTGLRTNVTLLDRPILVWITLAIIVVAIVCKFGGTIVAARAMALGWRESAVLGALMNTRGLTELIVLNLALELNVISNALYAALVVMALVTTFMTGPLVRVLDPRQEFSAPLEDELQQARAETEAESPVPVPEHSILVAPQAAGALVQLVALAEPLARSEPPRELVLARIVRPPRGADVRGGLQTESMRLAEASEEVQAARRDLLGGGVATRAVAFTSASPGADLLRLTEDDRMDLLLVDGRRPLLGDVVPRGDVGLLLSEARCDVAVLVAREDATVAPGPDAPLVVPFGGTEHDWAALELAAWMSATRGAPLKLVGATAREDRERDASRLLADASLVVQQFAGVAPEPVLGTAGERGVIEAAGDAALLVIGVSERWRQEGLGATRSAIAGAVSTPILFVRRGLRAGALAPRDDVTRFTWSSPGAPMGAPGSP